MFKFFSATGKAKFHSEINNPLKNFSGQGVFPLASYFINFPVYQEYAEKVHQQRMILGNEKVKRDLEAISQNIRDYVISNNWQIVQVH